MDNNDLRLTTTQLMGPQLQGVQSKALIAAVAGAVLCAIGFFAGGPVGFFPSYLFAYLFWIGLCIGSLGLLMLHHTVGGGWGYVIRRFLEAGSSLPVLGLMAVLFLPILVCALGIVQAPGALYGDPMGWANIAAKDNHHIQVKAEYLNGPRFALFAVLYFVVWGFFSKQLRTRGDVQNTRNDPDNNAKLNYLGGAGILLLVLTVTFMAVDWIMSLTPTWTTSIMGLLFVASSALSTLALYMWLLPKLAGDKPLVRGIPDGFLKDLGNLMLATTMLWGYMSYSQYVITFSGNTKEEVIWYVMRRQGNWGVISLALIPLHFGLPFMALLVGSKLKRSPERMARLAGFIVFMRFIDLWWVIAPTFRDSITKISPADLGAPLLIGGLWLWVWAREMMDRPVVPLHDPRLVEGLAALQSHHGHDAHDHGHDTHGHEVAAHG